MGRSKQVTPRKRAIIMQYVKDGLNASKISQRLNINRRTVCDIVNRFKATGSVEVGRRTGRPRVTSIRNDNMIRRASTKNPGASSLEIKLDTGLSVSPRTIRRRLVDMFGLRARRPAKKPLLTDQQRRKRVQFCRKYLHFTVANWNDVLFSDESTFCQFGSFINLVRRPRMERFNQRYTVATVKHSPKIMVWGSFSGKGRGCLYFIPVGKTVNSDMYLEILNDKLVRSMEILQCGIFQQDSAPAHTSRKVQKWMKDNQIKVLEWPGNSPDLNPIENLWMLVKRKVRNYKPKNLQELVFYIKRVWCMHVTPELCQRLVSSMPTRLKAVISNKGFVTKY